jgi:hypothetical protein
VSELSPKDKDLIAGARAAWEPPAGAEDRILAAVLTKVAPPAPQDGGGSGQAAPPAVNAASGIAKAWIAKGALFAVAAVGAGALGHHLATRAPEAVPVAAGVSAGATIEAPSEAAPAASEAPSASVPQLPPAASASAVPEPPVERPARPRPAPSAAAPAAPDPDVLRRETALMREAQKAIRDGDPERALKALDKHAGAHPGGVLREERLAARVQALCLTGKVDEARAALAELRRIAPQSPQLARLAGSCAAR